MATYLSLTQDVARESGTVPIIGSPATTSGQTGRLQRIVLWTQQAYREIQTMEQQWRWLFSDFEGSTIASVQEYDSAAMSIASRFSNWGAHTDTDDNMFTIYLPSEGQATEGYLNVWAWHDFRRTMMVGSAATKTGKPTHLAISPQNKLVFFPTPDAAYTVRGQYYKSPQTLTADIDVPEMPESFHEVIKWKALTLLGLYDEAGAQLAEWTGYFNQNMQALRNHQLPRLRMPEAFF